LVLDSYVALTFTPPNDNVSSTAITFIVRKYHLLPIVLAAILHMVALRRDAWRQIKVFAAIGSAVAKPCRLFKSRKHGAIRSCPYLETCLQLPSAI